MKLSIYALYLGLANQKINRQMKITLPISTLFFAVALTFSTQAVIAQKTITLEDIFQKRTFYPDFVWGINHMDDGEHYSTIEYEADGGQKIVSTDYKTGLEQTIVFSNEWVTDDDLGFEFDSYEISPDKKKILFATQTEYIYRHSTKADYVIWDIASKTMVRLSEGSKQMYPLFAPASDKIAFVQDNNLFIYSLSTGATSQLTNDGTINKIINGASDWVYEEELELTRGFEWSADGNRIAFYRFDETNVPEFNMAKYGSLYPTDYTFKYPKVGEENSKVSIHIFDLTTGQTTKLNVSNAETEYIPRIKWTHDPQLLSVQRMNRHQNKVDLLFVNTATGEVKTLFTESSDYYISITDNLTFLDNGKQFLWTSEQDGYNHIYLFGLDGKLVNQVTKGPWDVMNFLGVDQKSGLVYYVSSEVSPLERHIYSVKLNGKKQARLTDGTGTHEIEFSKNFKYGLHTFSNTSTPYQITIADNKLKEIRLLKDNTALKKNAEDYGTTTKAFFSFKTPEGNDLNGWMIKPPDFDPAKKYPVLMYVYGGPGSQTVKNGWGNRNDYWFYYLAQQGYIIASVDNRGTGARGEHFKKITYLKLGEYETQDQIAAAKHLSSLAYVDGNRIGIFGWSYGGYMSSNCLFRAADVFKSAIAVAPVTHWKYYDTIYTERFMRTYEENKKGYDNGSPITHAKGLEGKFLLIHGTADDNVHFQNSVEMVAALVEAGKQFDSFYYPDKNHGISGRNTSLHLYTMMTRFLIENL